MGRKETGVLEASGPLSRKNLGNCAPLQSGLPLPRLRGRCRGGTQFHLNLPACLLSQLELDSLGTNQTQSWMSRDHMRSRGRAKGTSCSHGGRGA